jgi:NAD+ synthase (glutamine-hydrolysing)
MDNHGFVRVAAGIPSVKIADPSANRAGIVALMQQAVEEQVQMVCFPELCITSYTCGDLFGQGLLLDEAESALAELLKESEGLPVIALVGMPVRHGNRLYNAAIIVSEGQILGVVPKTHLPSYNEFYEARWFAPGSEVGREERIRLCGQTVPFGTDLLFQSEEGVTFSVEVCEDLWTAIPPSSRQALAGSQILFNLSASDELIGKHDYVRSLIAQQSARCIAAYVYASAGFGESSTDLLFAGNGLVGENGTILNVSQRFSMEPQLVMTDVDVDRLMADRRKNTCFSSEADGYRRIGFRLPETGERSLRREVNALPFVPSEEHIGGRCEEIFNIQVNALVTRLKHTGIEKMVVGVSGGLDSTLALLVCAKAADRLGISRRSVLGITMPGFGTTDRTYSNAVGLIKGLGAEFREISIKDSVTQHFKDIGHDPSVHDVTYENSQARERTQILMDVANETGSLVIGTGDLSELALGWATYNGDQMSMYGVNASIPKTLVRHLVKWVAETEMEDGVRRTLLDIVDTPVSPELLPADEHGNIVQKTEDLVGPYELHDFYLYYTLRFGFGPKKVYYLARNAFGEAYEGTVIKKWLRTFYRRFFSQQFKRSAMPDGPKVGSVNLSPRGDWRMPSDASSALWIKEVDEL